MGTHVHFEYEMSYARATFSTLRKRSACGVSGPMITRTGNRQWVTCEVCKRTKAYKAGVSKPEEARIDATELCTLDNEPNHE